MTGECIVLCSKLDTVSVQSYASASVGDFLFAWNDLLYLDGSILIKGLIIIRREVGGVHKVALSVVPIKNEAVRKSAEMVKKLNLSSNEVEFISFSLEACKQLAELMPGYMVQYLNGKIPPKELKEMGIMGLDYHYSNFVQHPEWVKQAHDLGMIVNVWTVNKEEMMQQMIDLGVDYITTDKPELCLKLIQQ